MQSWQAVILGLIQGLTEFLPVSSSGHIRIFSGLFGWADPGAAFTAIIQIGTEAAVLLYFRQQVKKIAVSWGRSVVLFKGRPVDDHARMGWLIIVGTLPVVILGWLFKDSIETHLRSLWLVAAMLVGFAGVLWLADSFLGHRPGKELSQLGWRDGLIFGLAQSLALIPGVSRSGGTISAGLFMGYSRSAAARYSFLLAMPAVFGSALLELVRSLGEPTDANFPGWGGTVVATIVSFVVGYFVIIAFLKIVSTFSFKPFVYYRVAIGSLVLILLAAGVLAAQ